ncbi:DUF4147 domain-containing protein [Planctomycetota bacterium]
MKRTATESAIEIWHAGLDAVRSDRAVREHVQVSGNRLVIAGESFDVDGLERICVVGAGKAGEGMVAGLFQALSPLPLGDRLTGWVNVPGGVEQREKTDSRITLHVARPPGVNEPTTEAVDGTRRIVKMVEGMGPRDVCICLLSGGGSALLPLPNDNITLEQKTELTRDLSAAGANIQQLNAVRSHYSQIKAGGLARRCGAGHLISLIISDVIGDSLDVIASGPTVAQQSAPPSLSSVCKQLAMNGATKSLALVERVPGHAVPDRTVATTCKVTNKIIANNQDAVDAAVRRARALGFSCEIIPTEPSTTTADRLGAELAQRLIAAAKESRGPTCFVSGGEPIVRLAPTVTRTSRTA